MAAKIYKYFSNNILSLAFQREGCCGVKCSYPKDYNDPFELFLGVDLTVSPQLLAIYRDIVQELPQYPTTCFSQSPAVAPMWAHYADNHSGFVLEFDIEAMARDFDQVSTTEVTYRDSPNENINGWLQQAGGTKKPRHAYLLQRTVLAEAYFSKHTDWSYEREARLVCEDADCETVAGNMILYLPISCVSAIIVGQNISPAALDLSRTLAKNNDLNWYRARIGRSKAEPYFEDEAGRVAIFADGQIVPGKTTCRTCSEPIEETREFCPWCAITEAHALNAARGNPLRMLDRYGLLEGYYRDMDKISGTKR